MTEQNLRFLWKLLENLSQKNLVNQTWSCVKDICVQIIFVVLCEACLHERARRRHARRSAQLLQQRANRQTGGG